MSKLPPPLSVSGRWVDISIRMKGNGCWPVYENRGGRVGRDGWICIFFILCMIELYIWDGVG